jgi:hypothetical protein
MSARDKTVQAYVSIYDFTRIISFILSFYLHCFVPILTLQFLTTINSITNNIKCALPYVPSDIFH